MADPVYPLPKFHFQVDFTTSGLKANFTEVTGLSVETEAIEYRHGASREYHKTKQPGLKKFGNITLKRGTFEKDNGYFEWWNKTKAFEEKGEVFRDQIVIKLLGEDHNPRVVWKVVNAWPTKVQSADLKADANEIAIETIELAHEGISIEHV